MSDTSIVPLGKSYDAGHVNRIRNLLGDNVTVSPTAAQAFSMKLNTATGRWEWHDGTNLHQIAHLSDLLSLLRDRGNYGTDGVLPTAADATFLVGEPLARNDLFFINAAITLAGIQGDDNLNPGDLLILRDEANPTVAASWLGISRNEPQANAGNETVALAALPAETDTNVVATSLISIHSYSIRDATTGREINGEIIHSIVPATPNTLVLRSSIAYTALTIFLVGTVPSA